MNGKRRWMPRLKAAIVAQVRDGAATLEEVCARHELSAEEFNEWARAFEAHGVAGLRITRLQIYQGRGPYPPRRPGGAR
jgi:transposase-like protein